MKQQNILPLTIKRNAKFIAMAKYASYILTFLALLISCKNSGQKTVLQNKIYADGFQKITAIYKENVYDLSGYVDEGEGNPFNLFDENAYVDPRSGDGPGNYNPETDPQPHSHPEIYFPEKKGNRIVTDLQIPYQLSDVYIYDKAKTSDSVWIYTGSMQHWKLKAAFTTRSSFLSAGWQKFSLNDNSQYVMIQFRSPECAITEMVLYGKPDGKIPSAPSPVYTGAILSKKPMKEFLGANYFNETDPKWLKPFYYSRIYSYTADFDKDTVDAYPNVKYNMLRLGYWNNAIHDYYFFVEKLKKQNNCEAWHTIMGLPKWMARKGYEDKGRPLTQKNMDSEDPLSYARHANMMWNIAAFFGNTKVDTNLLSLSNSPRSSGRGSMTLYENGNEDDANWIGKKYGNPLEYFAQSSADFDGNENALGKKCGIKNADVNSKLITDGLIELDTNRIKVYKFLCNTLRNDKAFLWTGGIQYHHYSQKHLTVAITPEEDSLRWRLSKVRDATYRIQPGVPCILGENGYDKSQKSRQGTPMLPGLTTAQSQGIFILRSINATAFSGFDAYILYWLKDYDSDTSSNVYLTSGVIREMPDKSIKPYAGWFYISAFENRLANYVPDKIISETGNVWVYKYRNQASPDSVAYFVYCPTRNGTKVENYTLQVGKTANNNAQEIYFADDAEFGNATNKKIADNAVIISVEERPKLIMVKEKK
jgi:hypothetical protein